MGVGDGVGYVQTYVLRFLGSMEVRRDKGLDIVMDTIRKIMAARAIHIIFKMTEILITVWIPDGKFDKTSKNYLTSIVFA